MAEEEFYQWEKLNEQEWKVFKAQKLAKWSQSHPLDQHALKEADDHYKKFMEEIRKNESEKSSWKTEETKERKGGFRGQKWFFELLMDLGVRCTSEFKTNTDRFDLKVSALLSTVEVKIMTHDRGYANIKRNAWFSNPCSYLVVVEACDEEYQTFKFAGWLDGNDIHELDFTPKERSRGSDYFTAYQEDLNGARRMLSMLLKVSQANPYREPSFLT